MTARVATPFSRAVEAATNPTEAPWLARVRRDASERFAAAGLPTPRLEAWRTTPLPELVEGMGPAALLNDPAGLQAMVAPFRADGSPVLVFVDGRHAPSLSTPEADWPRGLRVCPLTQAVVEHGPAVESWLGHRSVAVGALADLNTAAFQDGAWIEAEDQAQIREEVRVIQISTACAAAARHLRSFVRLGRLARLRVTIADIGADDAAGFLNTRTSVDAGERSHLTLTRVHQSPAEVAHFDSLDVHLAAHSEVSDTLLQTGPSWTRSEIDVDLAGERATVDLGGVFIARGHQITDIHTTVSHNAPGVVSRQNYRGLAAEEGRGVFHGQIRVAAGARGADATQSNKNMLLSRRSQIHSTPALEILTDDVKCKHGSATGQIDPAQLFYLRSRGIDVQDAARILTRAFAAEILSRIAHVSTRELLEGQIAPSVDALKVAS